MLMEDGGLNVWNWIQIADGGQSDSTQFIYTINCVELYSTPSNSDDDEIQLLLSWNSDSDQIW